MARLIAAVYGEAFLKVALEKQQLAAFQEEAENLWRIWERHPELAEFLDHPAIRLEEKLLALDGIFRGRMSDELMGLVTILVEKGRQRELTAVCQAFIELANRHRKTGTAHVCSAAALEPDQKARIEQKLLETAPYEVLRMDYKVDASLLGGMVIRIGDRVVDGSVKTRLSALKKSLSGRG